MLTYICQYLRNWFSANEPKLVGTFVIEADNTVLFNGVDANTYFKTGQYVRVIGSTFNDGVICWGSDELKPEDFTGAIWGMAIPQAVIALSEEISEWVTAYKSVQNSPYASESFAGYSYTKASGNGTSGGSSGTWQDVFASRLAPWRKI